MTSLGRACVGMSAHETRFPYFAFGGGEVEVMEQISSIISNVGFPIACVIMMFHMWDKERQEHKAEADKWVEAINNNTNVMQRLIDKMGG